MIQMTLYHCESPCQKDQPCVRSCNSDNAILDQLPLKPEWKNMSTSMIERPELEKRKTDYVFENINDLLETHLNTSEAKLGNCKKRFHLVMNGPNVQLEVDIDKKVYNENEFCLEFDKSTNTFKAQVNINEDDQEKSSAVK